MHRTACGRASGLRGGAEVLGKGVSLCGGERRLLAGNVLWGRRGLTHFRRSSTRARVLLYIRPPCPRREIATMGPKDAPCEHPSPTKTSAPAPSAFIFPPRRSHFPRMAFGLPPNDVRPCRSNVHTSAPSFTFPPHTLRRRPRRLRPPAAVVIHNGLSTEKLSTSLPAALCKTFSPSRLRTRIYNISFARRPLPGSVRVAVGKRSRRCGPVSRAAERRVGEREGKGGRPLAQQPALSPHTAEPLPAYGRITVRKGGSAQGNPRPCRAFSPRQPAYGRAPAACVPNHCAQRRKCTRQSPPLPVRSSRVSLSTAEPSPADGRSAVHSPRVSPPTAAPPPADGRSAERRVGEGKGKGGRHLA